VRQDILLAAVQHNLRLTAIRPLVPSLDDIYRVAVERPLPKRGVKVKGRRRREAMAAAAASSATNEGSSGAVEPAEGVGPAAPGESVETTPSPEERDA
ncbi:MAG: hypothetical protein ACJ78H_02355, partial [Chloroflexota bacterium]